MPDGSARTAWIIGTLIALAMWVGDEATEGSSRPLSSASAPLPSPLPATAAGVEAPPDAGTDAVPSAAPVELGEAEIDRHVFREIMVGALSWVGFRRTWTLSRGATRAKLSISCQEGKKRQADPMGRHYMTLDGQENDPSRWLPPSVVEYAGAVSGKLSYRLAATSKPPATCHLLPDTFVLSCRSGAVSVLHAGATLVLDPTDRPDEGGYLHHWNPRATEAVRALRCQTSPEGDTGWHWVTLWPDTDVVFAKGKRGSPGVEHAFDNSDGVVQTGAYRWMPAVDDPR